jgi:lysyl-tRNA synthetase class 2
MISDWVPEADIQMLRLRAEVLRKIRQFFYERQVLEVETPILSSCGLTDPNIESFKTRFEGPGSLNGSDFYLRTSPEFHMKRLLAADCGSIFQIAKVFRQGEYGALHNPEFTLLEWYRPNYSLAELMIEVEELLVYLNKDWAVLEPSEILTYKEVFIAIIDLDPFTASMQELREKAVELGLDVVGDNINDIDAWLDLLMSHKIQAQLGKQRLSFLRDYPTSQAALASILAGNPPLAQRFELFYKGIELANGYEELRDAEEQRLRFEKEQAQRKQQGKSSIPLDMRLIGALAHGLPACSGVAIGIDRLLMLMSGEKSLHKTFAFPLYRA